jgi:hypothetical protein
VPTEGEVLLDLDASPLQQQLNGVPVGLQDRQGQVVVAPVRAAPCVGELASGLEERSADVFRLLHAPADVHAASAV